MGLQLTGTATAVTEKPYTRQDGSTGVLRKVSVINDAGTGLDQVTLTKNVPSPGAGEVVCYEVGVKPFLYQGKAYLDFTAYSVVEVVPAAPARAAE